MVSSCYW